MNIFYLSWNYLFSNDDDAKNDAHTFAQSSTCDDNEKC